MCGTDNNLPIYMKLGFTLQGPIMNRRQSVIEKPSFGNKISLKLKINFLIVLD